MFLLLEGTFWFLVILSVVLPVRMGIWAYMAITQIHLAGFRVAAEGMTFASASSLGLGGTFSVVVIPAILISKLRFRPLRLVNNLKILRIWVALFVYTLIASLWSQYQLSALKMSAYILWFPSTFGLMVYCFRRGWINHSGIIKLVWFSLFFAFLQTHLIGVFGKGERLTTFINVQYFSMFLVASLSYLLSRKINFLNVLTIIMVLFSVYLTGSRYALVGSMSALVVYWYLFLWGRSSINKLIMSCFALSSVVFFILGISVFFAQVFPESRMNQLLVGAIASGGGYNEIGTLVWRIGMYAEALNDIHSREFIEILFGSGTSSGAEVGIEYRPDRFSAYTVDANRIIHNEFLRSFYEWGVVGLFMILYIFFGTVYYYWFSFYEKHVSSASAFLMFSPTMFGALLIENSLSWSGGIAGMACVMLAAYGYRRHNS